MKWSDKSILVTGANGFMGTQVVKELEKRNPKKIICPSSKDCDLREKENCKSIVQNVDLVFHLAGKGGGIGIMKEKPGEIFFNNIMNYVFSIQSIRNNVKKTAILVGSFNSSNIGM